MRIQVRVIFVESNDHPLSAILPFYTFLNVN